MRISDWSSAVFSSDLETTLKSTSALLSLNGSTSSWLPLQRSMIMSRTRLPTVTFRIVLQDRQPSSNIATRTSTNEETGYENASPIPSWNTGNRDWRADCRSRRRTAGFAGCIQACCDSPGEIGRAACREKGWQEVEI